jgi:hypothetical protein
MLRPLFVGPPLEFGCDVELRLLVELESVVEPESARRMVPVDVPRSLSAERMLEHPVIAMPSAATRAIEIRCFILATSSFRCTQNCVLQKAAIPIPTAHRDR